LESKKALACVFQVELETLDDTREERARFLRGLNGGATLGMAGALIGGASACVALAQAVGSAHPEIRPARIDDAAELARLAGELGYPMSAAEMTRRLGVLLKNDRHYVAVAATGKDLFGCMHVEHRFSLAEGERAEIMGLIVDPSARGQGLGRDLVDGAESWARARSLSVVTVRSNVVRELSHPFYAALGYSREKTQHVYRKKLA
jgi:GNAT superfamily N-acetyltransferase